MHISYCSIIMIFFKWLERNAMASRAASLRNQIKSNTVWQLFMVYSQNNTQQTVEWFKTQIFDLINERCAGFSCGLLIRVLIFCQSQFNRRNSMFRYTRIQWTDTIDFSQPAHTHQTNGLCIRLLSVDVRCQCCLIRSVHFDNDNCAEIN